MPPSPAACWEPLSPAALLRSAANSSFSLLLGDTKPPKKLTKNLTVVTVVMVATVGMVGMACLTCLQKCLFLCPQDIFVFCCPCLACLQKCLFLSGLDLPLFCCPCLTCLQKCLFLSIYVRFNTSLGTISVSLSTCAPSSASFHMQICGLYGHFRSPASRFTLIFAACGHMRAFTLQR